MVLTCRADKWRKNVKRHSTVKLIGTGVGSCQESYNKRVCMDVNKCKECVPKQSDL